MVADIAKLSVGREGYYTRELASDHEQYLSGHGESPGRWYGASSSSLGLQGEASVEGFRRMFEGRHPDTGELLGRPHGQNAVPAFDMVLRPTKSVSILYGLGDPATGRAVLAAHHAGVEEAVAYLDGHLGTRRGHAGVQHVPGQGLLAVGFDHRTSREGDPLLHAHLVVANRVQGPDGRWTALDGRDLYRHRPAADAIYRATYQRELVRTLGVQWTAADTYGNRELQGMAEELLRLFSKRADRIDLAIERLERTDGSGSRGWSSGSSMPPASPRNRKPRTPCTTAGGSKRPNGAWTRTRSSGRCPAGRTAATRACPSRQRPSGWPGWPTELDCASAPPPDSLHLSAPEARLLLARPHLDRCLMRLTAFDQGRLRALLSSDDFGSSVERTGRRHPLWRVLRSVA